MATNQVIEEDNNNATAPLENKVFEESVRSLNARDASINITPEQLEAVCKALNIPPRRLVTAGLVARPKEGGACKDTSDVEASEGGWQAIGEQDGEEPGKEKGGKGGKIQDAGKLCAAASNTLETVYGVGIEPEKLEAVLDFLKLPVRRLIAVGLSSAREGASPSLLFDKTLEESSSEEDEDITGGRICSLFQDNGIDMKPREVRKLLEALRVAPGRFVKLGLVGEEERKGLPKLFRNNICIRSAKDLS